LYVLRRVYCGKTVFSNLQGSLQKGIQKEVATLAVFLFYISIYPIANNTGNAEPKFRLFLEVIPD